MNKQEKQLAKEKKELFQLLDMMATGIIYPTKGLVSSLNRW